MAGGVTVDTSSTLSDGSPMTPLSPKAKSALILISLLIFLEKVGYMAVAPSLIFYVRDVGGTDSQYGLIMSSVNLTSFFMIPIYASWVDSSENKYRKPFLVGSSLCILGMILYSTAILFRDSSLGISILFLSRFIYGIGGASGSVGFSYICSIVEHDQLNFAISVFSVATYLGMALGPFANSLLAHIDTTLAIPGTDLTLPLDAITSVGFFLAFNESLATISLFFFLPEPDEDKNTSEDSLSKAAAAEAEAEGTAGVESGWCEVLSSMASFRLLLPCFTGMVLAANYQIIEVAFPPAAAHGLNWGPVETSAVLGSSSIVMMIFTFIAMVLAHMQVPDTSMIIGGFIFWLIGGSMMFSFWMYPAQAWEFIAPIYIAMIGYPIIAPPLSSRFALEVASRKELESMQARLNGIFAMVGEVANFASPIFVGAYVMRTPEEIEEGTNKHELTPYALYIPIFSGICMLGWFYYSLMPAAGDTKDDELGDLVETETTELLPKKKKSGRKSSLTSIHSTFSTKSEASRLRASSVFGGNAGMTVMFPFDTEEEKHRREKLWEDKKHWEEMMAEYEKDSAA